MEYIFHCYGRILVGNSLATPTLTSGILLSLDTMVSSSKYMSLYVILIHAAYYVQPLVSTSLLSSLSRELGYVVCSSLTQVESWFIYLLLDYRGLIQFSTLWRAAQGNSSPFPSYLSHNSFSKQLKFSPNYCSLISYLPLSPLPPPLTWPRLLTTHTRHLPSSLQPLQCQKSWKHLSRDTKVYSCESTHNFGRTTCINVIHKL